MADAKTQAGTKSESNPRRTLTGWMQQLTYVVGVAMSVFHLYTAAFGTLEAFLQRSIHFGFAAVLTFLTYKVSRTAEDSPAKRAIDVALALLSGGTVVYLISQYERLSTRIFYVSPLTVVDLIAAVVVVLILLETTRRLTGWFLPIVALAFLAYAFGGHYLPGLLGHSGFRPTVIMDHLVMTTEGVFGIPVGISATYVILFVILAAFLDKIGAGDFFMKIALGLTGWMRGGPAKASVVASGLFGSISGAAVANVVSTGMFTIPLMKSIGYRPTFAAAVEAVASTGGQIMPPVMAATAFIMADFLQVPYLQVVKAALIPALLYYLAVFVMVHLEAVKTGLEAIPRSELPSAGAAFRSGWFMLLPFVALVYMLVIGYTPLYAGLVALAGCVIIGALNPKDRLTLKKFFDALARGAQNTVNVAITCATAGIVVGVITLTGVGLKFTALFTSLSGGNLLVGLVLAAVAGLILGMGLPTVPAYLVGAALLVPALMDLGVPQFQAHFFVFYFSVISCITPPVAIASYAAAGLARANPSQVGWEGTRLGIVAYLVPFMFVYGPSLLGFGTPLEITFTVVTAVVGVLGLACGITGYFMDRLPWAERLLFLAGGIAMINPDLLWSGLGFAAIVLALVLGYIRSRHRPRFATPA